MSVDPSRDARHPALDRGTGMIARRTFNHISAGLLSKFISRNNDIDGYWGLGVLYAETRASAHRAVFDLLDQGAQPASPVCVSVARTWALYLRVALARHGITSQALAAATVSVEFGLPLPKRPLYIPYGDPFMCVVHLLSADGREFTRRTTGYCLPYDRFHGRRSARWPG